MPPKPKFSKNEIVDAAYELAKDNGIEAVVAREVGKRLGTTTAPIFTYFNTMDELKDEVYKKASVICSEFLNESINYFPSFKEFGLRWVRFAKANPRIYEMLFMLKGLRKNNLGYINVGFIDVLEPMNEEVANTFGISIVEAENLINDMCIFAHGIASLYVNDMCNLSDEIICAKLSRMCISCVVGIKAMDGTLDQKVAKIWYENVNVMPYLKK